MGTASDKAQKRLAPAAKGGEATHEHAASLRGAVNDAPPNRIRELRDAQHMSVRDLAEKSGVDSATINRMERGTQPLDYPRGKRIAAAMGRKFSGILLDQDVELRVGEHGNAVLAELAVIPEHAWTDVISMSRKLVGVVQETAAQYSAGALGGDPQQVSQLAEVWRSFDQAGRDRALQMLALVNQGSRAP